VGSEGWGPPVVVTTGPEGRMVEAEEDGITVVRLPLVAWVARSGVAARTTGGGVAARSGGGGGDRSASLHGSPPGRRGYPEAPGGARGYPQPDWTRPHPAIATPEVVAAFRTFHPTAVFGMQVARALPGIVARHGIEAIEAPDTGAGHWFALNARRSGRVAEWQSGKVGAEGARLADPSLCHSATLPLCHLPFITHLHSPTEWIEAINGAESGRAVDELRRMEADVVRWSDGLVCPSRGMAEWAARHWGIERGRIAVIPYPIGELAGEMAPAPEPGPNGDVRLLFVGRLERRKGVDTLFAGFAEAARRLAARGDRLPIHLDVAGRDTPDPVTGTMFGLSHFERLIPPELRAQITLHDELAPPDVRRLLARAHAAIIPSPLDNFPNTCIEAMSAGRSVLAAAAGGAAEMIEDGASGLLFSPGDAAALANRLLQIAAMTPEERAQMGRAARARILALCDDDTVLQARLDHLRSVSAEQEKRAGDAGWGRLAASREGRPVARGAIILNRGEATDDEVAPLIRAVEAGEARFAHGWIRDVRNGRSVIDVHGTPSDGSLRWLPGPVGPIAVESSLLDETGLGADVKRDGRELLRRLIAAVPGAGAVVPEAIMPTAAARAQPGAPFEPVADSGEGAARPALHRVIRRLRTELRRWS
jgi:glycosyltransferase involved in cell wall biosynthesis